MIDAQTLRTQADYEVRAEIPLENAEVLINQAQAFITVGFEYLEIH